MWLCPPQTQQKHWKAQIFQTLPKFRNFSLPHNLWIQWLKYFEVPSAKDGIFYYDIDTMPGQSGSPVYEEKDPSKLVAIHKG